MCCWWDSTVSVHGAIELRNPWSVVLSGGEKNAALALTGGVAGGHSWRPQAPSAACTITLLVFTTEYLSWEVKTKKSDLSKGQGKIYFIVKNKPKWKKCSLQTHSQASASVNKEVCVTEIEHLGLQSALAFPSWVAEKLILR